MEKEDDIVYFHHVKIEVLWVNLRETCRTQLATVNLELVRNVWAGAIDWQVMALKVEADWMNVVEIIQRKHKDWKTGKGKRQNFEKGFLRDFGLKYLANYKTVVENINCLKSIHHIDPRMETKPPGEGWELSPDPHILMCGVQPECKLIIKG